MSAPIYVVDDEPYIRAAVMAILSEAGYPAQAFESGEELYQRVYEWPENPALIIVDEMLPNGQSGDQIVRTLRQKPEYRDIPFIFLTAVGSDAAERLGDLAPVIRKPFDFGDLVTRVEELIGPPESDAG
ncbi:MAG: response regulator transcription factor [Candidatus Limnocylindria bacterium]